MYTLWPNLYICFSSASYTYIHIYMPANLSNLSNIESHNFRDDRSFLHKRIFSLEITIQFWYCLGKLVLKMRRTVSKHKYNITNLPIIFASRMNKEIIFWVFEVTQNTKIYFFIAALQSIYLFVFWCLQLHQLRMSCLRD